jgi:DNA helicase IV
MKRLEAAGIHLPERSDNTFWQTEVPDAFDRLLEMQPLQYDAIIVDEGQDFMAPYWITIEKMLSPNGYFYIFYDPGQNLYKTDLEFPINEEPYLLTRNCRNTRQICNLLKRYTSQEMKIKEDAPEGKAIEEIRCSSDRERRKKLSRLLHKLVNEEGVAPERIMILGGHTIEHTCIGDNCRVGNYTIERDPEEGAHSIRYDTYMRFKGCEADAVILLDVDPKDTRWDINAFYTAISRAKFILYIIYKDGWNYESIVKGSTHK